MTTPRKAPEQANLNIDGAELVAVDTDESGQFITSYGCQYLIEHNFVTALEISFYYDLIFDANKDPATERQYFESLLLNKIAQEYGLESGNACVSPPESGNFYLVQATSLPEDVPNPQLDECLNLRPSAGQKCISYSGTMSGYVLGVDDSTPLLNFIASSLSSGVVTASTSLQVSFLGTQIDPSSGGRDSLTAAVNQNTPVVVEESNDTFTYVGILMTVALVCAFLGLVVVVWRMRQRRERMWRGEAVMATRAHEVYDMEENVASSFDGIIPPPPQNQGQYHSSEELPIQYGMESRITENMVIHPDDGADLASDGLPEHEDGTYTFDLGDNMKTGVLGKHGGSSSRRSNKARSIPEDSSDSDGDSWAQTDATLGSLEVRIGEITAEI